MAQIRHIAIFVDNPRELGDFYRDVFGMQIKGEGKFGEVWITDGHTDVALLKSYTGTKKPGINHFGFTLEEGERERVLSKLKERGVELFNPGPDKPYAEDFAHDPEGNRFDIAMSAVASEAGLTMAKNPQPM